MHDRSINSMQPTRTLRPGFCYNSDMLEDYIETTTVLTDEAIQQAMEKSAAVVVEYQQPTGAYPASPNFEVYNYSWFRDGAFIADGMSRAGHVDSAERFFDWCSNIVVERRDHILSGGKLDARYTYDGKESTEDWETFQLDGYGTLLWAIQQHSSRHNRDVSQYQEAAGLIQHYLATNWREPCFDWWEERKGRHAASLSCIYAGLNAYQHPEAHAVKSAIDLSNERTDSSLLICGLLDAVDSTTFAPVLDRIESELVSPDGGVYRYKDDTYYGGGEWSVLTNMLGWYYVKEGRIADAENKLSWVNQQIQQNGWIAEQSQKNMLHPENYRPWVEKWGQPANPLLWSQATMLTLASEIRRARQN
jgi:GH15 family glucan-1,4-alpha-glucosidase